MPPRKRAEPTPAAPEAAAVGTENGKPAKAQRKPTKAAARQKKAASEATSPATISFTPGHEELERLVGGAHFDPHSILGAHPIGGQLVIRTLRPHAQVVTVVVGDQRIETQQIHPSGVFQAVLEGEQVRDYRLEVAYGDVSFVVDDPYRFLPTLGEVDLHLIGEGRHERLWTVLGSHVRRFDGDITGTSFAVWAPNARGVRVSGDFNYWDGSGHPLRSLGSSGVWELFIPDIGEGTCYKFQILGADSVWREKADPMARRTEVPPATGSVVTESAHEWNDTDWVNRRAQTSGTSRRCRSTKCTWDPGGPGSDTGSSRQNW